MDSLDSDDGMAFDQIRQEWESIARQEVARHRRRLGLLTPEQEAALESILISVTDHMFEVVVHGVVSCPTVDSGRFLSVWCGQPIAA